MDPAVNEFASYKELIKRQRRRMKRKMLGIKPGSGFELHQGMKRRIDPKRLMMLKRRGHMMARRASQQVRMRIGRKRSAGVMGLQRPKGATQGPKKVRKLSASADQPGPVLIEYEDGSRAYAFSPAYIIDAIRLVKEGRPEAALEKITRNPKFAEKPIGYVAESMMRRIQEHKLTTFVDVEVVDEEHLIVYGDASKGNPEELLSVAEAFGEARIIVKAGEALTDSQKSRFTMILVQPSKSALKTAVPKDLQAEATTSAGVGGFLGGGVQGPVVTVSQWSWTPKSDDPAYSHNPNFKVFDLLRRSSYGATANKYDAKRMKELKKFLDKRRKTGTGVHPDMPVGTDTV